MTGPGIIVAECSKQRGLRLITRTDLRKTAREYLQSAEILRANRKYDVAIYLCGYAVEIALKDRICRTLKWAGFPSTAGEFSNYRSFQTHNLEVLLNLSASGDTVTQWNPEHRYNPRGAYTAAEAASIVNATKRALRVIL